MLGSFTQMGRKEEWKGGRGGSVNLRIIRQCSDEEEEERDYRNVAFTTK